MEYMTDTPHDLKNRFTKNFAYPLNDKYYDYCTQNGLIPIKYSFKKDPHFFQRILERKIDKKFMGSIFKKLFDEKYCEILYLFHANQVQFENDKNNLTLQVNYKNVSIIFVMYDDSKEKFATYKLMPATVLKVKDFNSTFEINLD